MIDLNKVEYRVVAVTPDGQQLDLTDITHGLGWREGEKELSAKITLKLANADYGGKNVSELVQPFTPLIIYASMGGSFEEVIRGTIQKWGTRETNGELFLNIEAADEVQTLRRNQDHFYFTADHSSSAIINEIFGKWGVPFESQVEDVTHAKKVYNKKYLIDMIEDVLTDIKEKGGEFYFVRAKGGVIQIIPRGTNEITYHFDIEDNLIRVEEDFDVSSIVTRVLVVAKGKEEGHQSIEATVDGKIDLGVRQVIYERGNKTTLEEAQKAAEKILKEQGDAKHDVSIEAPDIPTLRKGDRIRVRGSNEQDMYYFVKSIRHNAASQRMTLELDEDKEMNSEYDTCDVDESDSSSPP